MTGCRTDRIDGWRDKCEIGDKCSDTVNAHLHREGTVTHSVGVWLWGRAEGCGWGPYGTGALV